VTFSTNNVEDVAAKLTDVAKDTELGNDDVPSYIGGTWDVDPVGAVITCNTNFNYSIPTPVTPDIQLSATYAEYTAELEFPTVTVEGYTEGTDYDKAWSPDAITEPTAGTTNEYTVTVTMKGAYTGSNTAKFYVWKAAPAPTMYNVTFSTNTVAVAEHDTTVEDGKSLTADQIPEFTGGKWDVDPSTAVITCATNFNYTIETKVYPPSIPEEKKAAYDTWKADVAGAEVDPTAPETKEAFLLNCSLANLETAKAAFKIISITKDGEHWVVKVAGDVGDGEAYGNGVVTIEEAEITGASEDAEFFKAVLDYEQRKK